MIIRESASLKYQDLWNLAIWVDNYEWGQLTRKNFSWKFQSARELCLEIANLAKNVYTAEIFMWKQIHMFCDIKRSLYDWAILEISLSWQRTFRTHQGNTLWNCVYKFWGTILVHFRPFCFIPFFHSSLCLIVLLNRSFRSLFLFHSFFHNFVQFIAASFIHSFIHSFIRSSVHPFIISSVHSCIYSMLLFLCLVYKMHKPSIVLWIKLCFVRLLCFVIFIVDTNLHQLSTIRLEQYVSNLQLFVHLLILGKVTCSITSFNFLFASCHGLHFLSVIG